MMPSTPQISRRFPRIAWAWPDGGRHLLIMAAICPDQDRAFAAIESWLRQTDLDDASFAEHRLLSAITTRFDARLAHHPEYARLCGLQRLNWTRSRMAISASKPVLEKMVTQGLKVILLKGACRVALDMAEQKSRTSYDLDVLLSPSDFSRAFEILAADGWASTRGETVLGLRARLSSVRARNFKKGRFGDIDLHRAAYHTASARKVTDAQLFDDAQPVEFYGLKMFIPSAEERLAMAIAHGGWDGQSHSDWLVDVAHILDAEPVDWAKFKTILKNRRLRGQAGVALSYLDQAIGVNIPKHVLADTCGTSGFPDLTQFAAMLLAKEASSLSRGQKIARSCVVNYQRIWHSGRDKGQDTPVFRTLTRSTRPKHAPELATSHSLELPAGPTGETWKFAVTIVFPAPPRKRRIELEINSQSKNLCHLQAFHLGAKDGFVAARFRGEIVINAAELPLVLTALPGKLLEEARPGTEHEKYTAVPFAIADLNFTQSR